MAADIIGCVDVILARGTVGSSAGLADRLVQAAIYRGTGKDPRVLRAILDARASWLTWQTVTQRKWQRDTRSVSRARHHDSVEIREKYVRCYDKPLPAVYRRPHTVQSTVTRWQYR